MNSTTLKPPFGWVGGKTQLAKEIVSLIPEDHNLYVEVFAGALSVLYAKKSPNRITYREVINDYNEELINLHRCIRKYPETLQMYLNQLLISRTLFEDIKNGKCKPRNDIERAAFYFFRIRLSFGKIGDTFAMNAKHEKPNSIYTNFFKWAKRLKFVTIENMDFEKLIKTYDRKEAFFYCDPPYFETEIYYKNSSFNLEDHRRLFETLKNIKGRFLLSYNDCDYIRELYKDFNIIQSREIEYTLQGMINTKRVKEIYITNYKVKTLFT